MASTKVKIPTIDFSNLELKPNTPLWESTKVQVFEALKEYGCFEAIYDKIPNEIREGMIPHLPFYESLCIPDLLNPQNVETFANIFWPHGNPDFCNLVKAYSNPLMELDEMLKKMILENLGLENHIDELLDINYMRFRLTHYKGSSIISGDHENNIKHDGLNGHTDGNFLTFISQNQVNGLQINKNGEWIDVNISPNSYVVLSGDSFKAPKELVDEEHPLLFKPFEMVGLSEYVASQAGYAAPSEAFKAYCGL
ncbi:hypothetical protein KY290_000533 [Solanum tuberosum]|uniref:Isopenicillin N synthase-like Fe(2+) 2OG dioxygenase domain-containing protein n=1 Tax=Solanum tuberosum TaxID=4113 RepID=A0ABQ7WK52_SOLTU|nr:hypothetical protein KY289_000589 [Solanum tuberosum]KAH0780935.1 hypothetical protein KY290_000533 [Solanum tuberosum]